MKPQIDRHENAGCWINTKDASLIYLWCYPAEVGGQYLQWEMWLYPPAHFLGWHRGQIQGQCFGYLSTALLVGILKQGEQILDVGGCSKNDKNQVFKKILFI